MSSVVLKLEKINYDGSTQPRVGLNESVVSEYAEALTQGVKLPPVVVFHDGSVNWLADGFHRFHAHRKIGAYDIEAEIRTGTRRDAILYSVGANASHGLRRTNEDKRKAVMTLLEDAEWGEWSDREIAKACGVSHSFVAAIRKPDVAAKQKENRNASAARKVESDSNKAVESDSTRSVDETSAKKPKRTLESELQQPAIEETDHLAEAHHTITELAAENDKLRDQLAVENMDASEEAKLEAQTIISELRERVRILELENEQLKLSRDTYMREAAEKQKQITYWRRQAERGAV